MAKESSMLNLSTAHERILKDYFKFCRLSRAQSVKDLESSISDFADSRLLEDTYTSDEVRQMLDALCAVVKGDVSSDLIHGAHSAALMLQQILQQADKWHLKLQVDLAQLESREGMKRMADFEQQQLQSNSSLTSVRHKFIAPINSAGGDQLLQAEITRLNEENVRLRDRVQHLEQKATSALSVKDALQADMKQLKCAGSVDAGGPGTAMEELQAKMAVLEMELQKARSGRLGDSSSQQLQSQLEQTSKDLLRVTHELEEAREELNAKFNSTSQYVNMKKMLASKNKLIAELRSQLHQQNGGDSEDLATS